MMLIIIITITIIAGRVEILLVDHFAHKGGKPEHHPEPASSMHHRSTTFHSFSAAGAVRTGPAATSPRRSGGTLTIPCWPWV